MPNTLPRGAIPSPRFKLAAAIPHKIVGVTPPNYIWIPQQLSFWGNDKYGDCVTAEEAFAKACNNPEIFVSDDGATSWASQHNFLNGAVISSVLETMVGDGFRQGGSTYDDGPANTVDWTNAPLLQNAIALGPVKIGIASKQLDNVYKWATNGWVATGFQPDGSEDHCVSLCGYGTIGWLAQQLSAQLPAGVDGGQSGYAMFTWSSIGIIDEPSMLAITHEAWLRNPTTNTVVA